MGRGEVLWGGGKVNGPRAGSSAGSRGRLSRGRSTPVVAVSTNPPGTTDASVPDDWEWAWPAESSRTATDDSATRHDLRTTDDEQPASTDSPPHAEDHPFQSGLSEFPFLR